MLKISCQKNVQVDIQTPAIKINYRKHFHFCFTVLKTNRRMYKKKQKTESHLDKKDQELMFPVASRIKTTSSPT